MSSTLRDELASLRIERKPGRSGRSYGRKSQGSPWAMRFLTFLLFLIPVGLIGGALAYGYREYGKIRPKVEVSVASVQQQTEGDALKVLEAKGYLKARFKASVGTKLPGRVKELYVEEGSVVKAGDLLAELEHNEIDAQLATRDAAKARAEADLAEARADLIAKDRRASRLSRLYSQNNASFEDVDLANAERDKCKARVIGLEAQIKVIDAQVREVQETLKNLMIYAPFSGTVLTKSAEKGETINTMSLGAGGGRSALIELADLKSLEVETDVAEKELARVRKGQFALVEVSAVPGRVFKAHVRQIIQMGDRARGEVKIYVAIDELDDRLFPELYARVKFLPQDVTEERLDSLSSQCVYLDRSALITEGEKTTVWLLDADNVARRREINITRSSGKIRVDKGLSVGDRVVLDPPDDLQENQTVRLKQSQ